MRWENVTTLSCRSYGYPAPSILWYQCTGIRTTYVIISDTDSLLWAQNQHDFTIKTHFTFQMHVFAFIVNETLFTIWSIPRVIPYRFFSEKLRNIINFTSVIRCIFISSLNNLWPFYPILNNESFRLIIFGKIRHFNQTKKKNALITSKTQMLCNT